MDLSGFAFGSFRNDFFVATINTATFFGHIGNDNPPPGTQIDKSPPLTDDVVKVDHVDVGRGRCRPLSYFKCGFLHCKNCER